MDRPRIVGDYELLQQIGSGSFAVVWKAKHRHTGMEVAIKEIAADKLNQKLCDNLMSEIDILQRTNHPNIIRLYATIPASNRIFLVLEFCAGGDLGAYIQKQGRVSVALARHFMRQLGAGLQVLRANNLIHRDLKPQNLLLSTNDVKSPLKIADFGFARSLQPQGMAETLCGSPLYMAPEILQSKKYDAKADLWSVGTILYQLITGRPPFLGQSPFQLLQNIQKSNELRFPSSVNAEMHPECIDLCRKLLRKDPVERLSFEEFFNHSFIADPIRHQPCFSNFEERASTSATRMTQDDTIPFLQQQFVLGPPNMNARTLNQVPPFSSSFKGSRDVISDEREIREGTRSKGNKPFSTQGISAGPECEGGGAFTSHSKGALMDSDEYVLVSVPITSTGMSSFSTSEQFTNKSPAKCIQKNNPRCESSVNTIKLEHSQVALGSIEAVGDMSLLTIRLSGLQKCAETIAELANEKYLQRQYLEAFSMQLVCLAAWKEALSLGQREGSVRAMNEADLKLLVSIVGSKSEHEIEAVNFSIKQSFSSAVARAEKIAPHLYSLGGDAEIPDAMDIIFQTALTRGRTAAAAELIGNFTDAAVAYTNAAILLYFLLVEAVSLQPTPLILDDSDRQRLSNYIELLLSRQKHCDTTKMDLGSQS